MKNIFNNIYKGKKILLTGHSGFKGSWMYFWLKELGADVLGYSLLPQYDPSHIKILYPDIEIKNQDILNINELSDTIQQFKPNLIFHFAAQSLVRQSYKEPVDTFNVNIIGTVNILEVAKRNDFIEGVVIITSDKCYENKDWIWGYRENDSMGGYDPYSASKGCAELVTSSYRNSFFNKNDYKLKHNTLIASVRAGNVIGGGDWAEDRLIPDLIRSVENNNSAIIRNQNATRPWQHVLEPLSGYLLIGQKLFDKNVSCADAWNFGPDSESDIKVKDVIPMSKNIWDKISYKIEENKTIHEANLLKLDCSKSNIKLGWKSVWEFKKTIENTIEWYKNFYEKNVISTKEHLDEYIENAIEKQIIWTK